MSFQQNEGTNKTEMKQQITQNLGDAGALEKLYRENRREFTRGFSEISEEENSPLVRFWKIRLAYEPVSGVLFSLAGLVPVLLLGLFTWALMKVHVLIPGLGEAPYYLRTTAAIVVNALVLYTLRRNAAPARQTGYYAAVMAVLMLYVWLLPMRESDSLNIAFMHVPLFLWCIYGLAWLGSDFRNPLRRMEFIRFNGELVTMTGLLLITGGILTGITVGLFEGIGWHIQQTYAEWVAIPGAAAAPLLAAYLIGLYPDITRKIVPVIARVFTPVVLVTLTVYLVSLAFSGVQVLEDRNLLVLFNVMLVAVTAMIVFSVSGLGGTGDMQKMLLLLLAGVTLVINAIALIAIVWRLGFGLTPNRLTVLVTNILVFVNLLLVAFELYRSWRSGGTTERVERLVANYLAVYFGWSVVAVFLLPLVFGFR